MVNRHTDNGQTQSDVHSLRTVHLACFLVPTEAHHLKGNVTLVVIHGHTAIVFAATRLGKECVGRYGTFNQESSVFQFVHGRDNFLLFLPAKQTIVAGMGIESGNTDTGLFYAKLAAGIVNEFGHLNDAVFLHTVASLAQRHMGRNMDDT